MGTGGGPRVVLPALFGEGLCGRRQCGHLVDDVLVLQGDLEGVKFVDPPPDAGAILVEVYGDNFRLANCTFEIRGSALTRVAHARYCVTAVEDFPEALDGEEVALDRPLRFTTQPLWQWRTDPPSFTAALGSCAYVNDPPYDRPGDPYGGGWMIRLRVADASELEGLMDAEAYEKQIS